jgi:hypothetical protein
MKPIQSLLRNVCIFAALAMLIHSSAASGQELKEWQNPKLTGENNQNPHSILIACPDAKTARSIQWVNNRERVKSPFYRSLNGDWKYH